MLDAISDLIIILAAISFVEEKSEPIDEAAFNEETGVGKCIKTDLVDLSWRVRILIEI
jgi:hypothetical protein